LRNIVALSKLQITSAPDFARSSSQLSRKWFGYGYKTKKFWQIGEDSWQLIVLTIIQNKVEKRVRRYFK
jgi:hypothetical protein